MRVGIDDPLDGTWEKFAGEKQITFPSEGSQTVYVSFRDETQTIINTVSDTIFLDSIASISEVTEDSQGQTLKRGSKIHLTLNANGETGVSPKLI